MNRRLRYLVARTIGSLFALNIVSLALYFLLHPHAALPASNETLTLGRSPSPKPWPLLPSFLPWRLSPAPPLRSCEAYFGHGFSRRIDLLSSPDDGRSSGWFQCFYSETLRSSVCEGGRIRMDPGKIRMSVGGESLESVMGRREEEELPKYEAGAFVIEGEGSAEGEDVDRVGEVGGGSDRRLVDSEFLDRNVPRGAVQYHTMRALLESMQVVGRGELQCRQWIDEPTLLVTRFEYANLFHTVTDWYSAYVSSRVTSLPSRPNLVFLDGHCKAPLEETWEALFSSVKYAKNFSGPVCFSRAILAPLGYETALFKGLTESISCQGTSAQNLRANPDDRKTSRLSEFGEMLRSAFDILGSGDLPRNSSAGYNVLFVRREDYLAHPRHSGRVESRLTNEPEVFNAISDWAAGQDKCKINVVNGLFAHMNMSEQLRSIQEASVVIGAHGAGLTHLVAATPGTIVLEIISSMYRRPHFALISEWKGLEYHAINLAGTFARPAMVIDELSSIMSSLGC